MTTLIIGGGWSGLAAAITLSQQGHPVHLIESAKQLGGRARNVEWQGNTIDNGQHLMIGAYDRMLAIMELCGVDPTKAFNRVPLDLSIYDDHYPPLHLSADSILPWPLSVAWNLIRSTGFSGFYRIARLQAHIPKVLSGQDISVQQWLQQTKQPDRLIKQLWEPLCLASLNTPIKQASAHVLATVLQDSLAKNKHAADLLIPKQALGDLFPKVAAEYICRHGGEISLQTRVKQLIVRQNEIQGLITNNGKTMMTDTIIVATSPSQMVKLLSPDLPIDKPDEYPICTVYLQFPEHTRLPKAIIGMSGTLAQWLFDRSEQQAGLIAVVISGPSIHEKMSKTELVQQVCTEIHALFPTIPKHIKSLVIREKRATFASTVASNQKRPKNITTIKGLWLAGDYIANSYPATLEGTIQNGENCAQQLLTNR